MAPSEEKRTGSEELHDYVVWLEREWLPNFLRQKHREPLGKPRPTLTLVKGGRVDAN